MCYWPIIINYITELPISAANSSTSRSLTAPVNDLRYNTHWTETTELNSEPDHWMCCVRPSCGGRRLFGQSVTFVWIRLFDQLLLFRCLCSGGQSTRCAPSRSSSSICVCSTSWNELTGAHIILGVDPSRALAAATNLDDGEHGQQTKPTTEQEVEHLTGRQTNRETDRQAW